MDRRGECCKSHVGATWSHVEAARSWFNVDRSKRAELAQAAASPQRATESSLETAAELRGCAAVRLRGCDL